MKPSALADLPPEIALQNRVRQQLGLDLRSRSLAEVVDLTLDRLEGETEAVKRRELAPLASLLIQLEAAALPRPADTKSSPKPAHLVERDRLRRRAAALAEWGRRGYLMLTAQPTIAPPPATRSAFFAESDTEYLSYGEACAGGPAALERFYRQRSISLLDIQQKCRHWASRAVFRRRLEADPAVNPCLITSLLEVHWPEHYYRLPARFHVDQFLSRKFPPLAPPIRICPPEASRNIKKKAPQLSRENRFSDR